MNVLFFPGQGAQYKGMGKELFTAFPQWTKVASDILGYEIDILCVDDPDNHLRLTQYTQPALYVVNVLRYYRWREQGIGVDALAGHSLGELCALHAAGSFDFETGLRIVKKRGQLMGQAGGGGMAAVLGMRADALLALLREHHLEGIDLANLNSPTQLVIAGDQASIAAADKLLNTAEMQARKIQCIALNVSAPFHSRYMRDAQQKFASFLQEFELTDPSIPVIANATARPYIAGQVAATLAQQIASPVQWIDSIRYLMGVAAPAQFDYIDIGADPQRIGGTVLSKLVEEIRTTESPVVITPPPILTAVKAAPLPVKASQVLAAPTSAAQNLGSEVFRQRYGLKYAYVAGAMYRGTASTALVIKMGQAGLIGYLGTGGLSLSAIETALQTIQAQLPKDAPYGVNLLADYADPAAERATVDLYLKYGVCNIEAAAFMQMTAALVLFRVKGLSRHPDGSIQCTHHILAKVSRLEVAQAFMNPPPAHVVDTLFKEGAISAEQATLAKQVPTSHDICVEADSGGHTDGGIPTILLPAMQSLQRSLSEQFTYQESVCVGLAGGIGTPSSAAAAFAMGADFILTGSINQCTVESGASNEVKAMLQQATIHDMAYAPAGDMFEVGARVQVLKKGLLFPMRANKLFALYSHCESLDAIPDTLKTQLERNYFKRSFTEVWQETLQHLQAAGRTQDIAKAQANPKVKMAAVFKWYFGYSTRLAFSGSPDDLVNYQVHTGPALGAFNQWGKATSMESWTQRHVDQIGIALMEGTAAHLRGSYERYITT